MNKPHLLLAAFTFIAVLALVGCEGPVGSNGSGGGANDSGDGDSATTEYGINVVNAETDTGPDFTVSYIYSFCRDGESDNDCVSRGFGAGLVTAGPGENAIGGNDTPFADEVRYYLEWEVTSGNGRIEFAAVDETDFGTFVEEVLDSFDVTDGSSGSNSFPFE